MDSDVRAASKTLMVPRPCLNVASKEKLPQHPGEIAKSPRRMSTAADSGSLWAWLHDRDETTSHRRCDGGRDQCCLRAPGLVGLHGCHTAKSEEEDASSKEEDLEQGRRLSAICLCAGPQTQANAKVRQVAGEVRGAHGKGAALSRDPVLDALGEGPQEQALGGIIVAHSSLCLAVVNHAAEDDSKCSGQQVRRVLSQVDGLLVSLGEARHKSSRSEGCHQVKELDAAVEDQTCKRIM